MVTLHEVITFLVSMQISISSLQTHNVNRCGRSRHLARKLSLRRKRSSPNVFEMAATETITRIILLKLIRHSLGTVRHPHSSKKLQIAEGQWYRYAPSYVSPAYHLLEGFPFIQEPPSGDLQERVLIRHHDYDQCFQSVQLLQWNSQVKFNVTVYRNLPTTRDSIM